MNWRAFGIGALAAALVAILVAVVLRPDEDDGPSLGAAVPEGPVAQASSVPPSVGPLHTLPPEGELPLEPERLLSDPCGLLTEQLRVTLSVAATPRPDGDDRCVAGSGNQALEVEVHAETLDPFTTGAEFQVQYGERPRPIDELGLAYHVQQGDRTLIAVFATGVSVQYLVPTLEIEPSLIDALRDALL